MQIKCPKCSWPPSKGSNWACETCGYEWNVFETVGRCPRCGSDHHEVYCIEWEGGCGEMSPYLDWYEGIDDKLLRLNVKKLFD